MQVEENIAKNKVFKIVENNSAYLQGLLEKLNFKFELIPTFSSEMFL